LSESDFFVVLRKRHSCRHFESTAIPDELLDKLVYAAHRAPTGGNSPHRFVVVVKDPVQLRMLKLASPGYFGASSAAIVVCTDLRVAEQGLGRLGMDQCAMYDAGAAAENVALMAYALGLGACFVKSYSEIAVKRILELPDECRTELIVSVGYPAKDEPPPTRKRIGNRTYRDQYAKQWIIRDKDDDEVISVTGNESNTPEEHIFELALFLLTAARGCVEEPQIYGPLRLLDAIGRLVDLYSKTDLLKRDEFLIEARKKVDEGMDRVMVSNEEFVKFMDEMVRSFTDEMIKRYGSAVS
jgi:nitroreductase